MATRSFPERIDPFKFAETGKLIDGIFATAYFDRLCQELYSDKGEIACKINGLKNHDTGLKMLQLEVSGEVELVCQGCTEPFMHQLEHKAILYPCYTEEQMKQMPDDGEPVLADEDGLDIKSVVEDELILSLPLIPLFGECEELEAYQVGELPELTDEEVEKENPFAALKNLKI
ncbi:MAG: DUF177 domain-containing protein [Gammaproteobacteria bacterium]|nr:DUF177 domain-containing protein [Gammaproteobacteria bacterium]